MTRHDSHLTPLTDDPGTIPTDHPRLVLRPQGVVHHDLVPLRNPLGDGHDQGDLGFDRFEDGGGGEGRWDVDDGCVGVLVFSSLGAGTNRPLV